MSKGLLTVSKDGEIIKKLEFDSEIVLGRGDDCDLKLDDRAISRKHAVIRPIASGVQIEKRSLFSDLKVNGVDFTSCILKNGDSFEIGPYSIQMSGDLESGKGLISEPVTAAPDIDDAPVAPVIEMGAPESGVEAEIETKEEFDSQSELETSSSESDDDFLNLDPIEPESEPNFEEEAEDEDAPIEMSPPFEEQSDVSAPLPTQEIDPMVSKALDAEFGSDEADVDSLKIEPSKDLAFGNDASLEVEPSAAENHSKLSQSGNIEFGADDDSAPISLGEGSVSLAPPEGASSEFEADVKPFEIDMTSNPVAGAATGTGPVRSSADTQSAFNTTNTKTRAGGGELEIGLEFVAGTANVTAIEIGEKEIFIGRGKKCDVVLNDKKASRKHISIKRQGVGAVLNDLDSANGTYVNDVKVTSKRLSGNDRIRIGNVEFKFVAKRESQSSVSGSIPSADYSESSISLNQSGSISQYIPQTPGATKPLMMGVPGIPGHMGTKTTANPGQVPGASTQVSGAMGSKLKSPGARKKILYALVVVMLAWTMFEEEIDGMLGTSGSAKPKVAAKSQKGGKTAPTFQSLPPEKQKFVKSQYDLALDLYQNGEYEKSVFEIRKIFRLIPNYKDAKDIEVYAIEAQRRLEANNEEKRREEEEKERKRKVAELTEKARGIMDAKQYDRVGEIFVQILAMDPENKAVAKWQQTIDEYKEERDRLERERRVQAQINNNARDIYNSGVALQNQRRWFDAIRKFNDAKLTGLDDKQLINRIDRGIASVKQMIADEVNPVIEEAKLKEQEGDIVGAFKLYEKALKIDPQSSLGRQGIDRIEGVLNEKAKFVYTEAVVAESYSDFKLAKKKFIEVLDIVPSDNKYYQRAERKLQRYTVIPGPRRSLSSTPGNSIETDFDEGGFDE